MKTKSLCLGVAFGVAAGAACSSGGGRAAPTPTPCYALSPPNCTFSGDVLQVLGQPDPLHSSASCYEGGCHTGSSPAMWAGELLLGPASGAYPSSTIWYLLITSGGAIQRAGQGRDVVVSTNVALAQTSLLLSKADQDNPTISHAGCKCWAEVSAQYQTILSWIVSGAKDN